MTIKMHIHFIVKGTTSRVTFEIIICAPANLLSCLRYITVGFRVTSISFQMEKNVCCLRKDWVELIYNCIVLMYVSVHYLVLVIYCLLFHYCMALL